MYILISPVTYWDKLELNFNVIFNLLDRASDLIFIGETKILRCKAENQMLTSICSWEELSFDASGGRRRLKQQMDTTTDRIEINMIRSKSHKNMKIMPSGTGAQKYWRWNWTESQRNLYTQRHMSSWTKTSIYIICAWIWTRFTDSDMA